MLVGALGALLGGCTGERTPPAPAITVGAHHATPAEIACMREAVAAAAFPASACDTRVVLHPGGTRRILPNPYR